MSLEAIKNIAAAEEKARQKKLEAQQTAKKLISEAEAAGIAAVSDSKKRAGAEAAALTSEAEANAIKFAEELRDNTFNKCAAMRARSELRLDSAAALIVRRVVEN